jgi:hypothetical protein
MSKSLHVWQPWMWISKFFCYIKYLGIYLKLFYDILFLQITFHMIRECFCLQVFKNSKYFAIHSFLQNTFLILNLCSFWIPFSWRKGGKSYLGLFITTCWKDILYPVVRRIFETTWFMVRVICKFAGLQLADPSTNFEWHKFRILPTFCMLFSLLN